MLATPQTPGVVPSFSRPSFGDDNPNSKRLFRTLKYAPRYPSKPFDSIERFNRTHRDELLDLYLIRTLGEVRQMTEDWMVRHNKERPHDSLTDMTLVEYLQAHNHP